MVRLISLIVTLVVLYPAVQFAWNTFQPLIEVLQ